ncbi:RL13 [Hepatospora eriocheir]|uniref:RL13 n=1 Tax=Hepatospora eriocheir TaxID=1081669 RepID=A0A1X0QIX9_9MICR|nr:RL13 [Hepatospora eriocheir]
MKRNNAVPKNHFQKTSKVIKTRFNQPTKAIKRREVREEKMAKLAVTPLTKLRPVVRCPTIRYNRKVRLGRGFTLEECNSAGIHYLEARTLGISVDLRRKNQNEEAFNRNVERIKEYLSNVTVYKNKTEAIASGAYQHHGVIMPVFNEKKVKLISTGEVQNEQ